MTRKMKLVALLFATAALLVLSSGCLVVTSGHGQRSIRGHLGCDTKVAAHKRGQCHKCVSKGPRWLFQPHRAVGFRCIRR
jgi:hypothetical protein